MVCPVAIVLTRNSVNDVPKIRWDILQPLCIFYFAFVVSLATMSVLYTKIAIFGIKEARTERCIKWRQYQEIEQYACLLKRYLNVSSQGPAVAFSILKSYGVLNNTASNVVLTISWLVVLTTLTSSLANPLIYAYYNRKFRRELIRLFRIRIE